MLETAIIASWRRGTSPSLRWTACSVSRSVWWPVTVSSQGPGTGHASRYRRVGAKTNLPVPHATASASRPAPSAGRPVRRAVPEARPAVPDGPDLPVVGADHLADLQAGQFLGRGVEQPELGVALPRGAAHEARGARLDQLVERPGRDATGRRGGSGEVQLVDDIDTGWWTVV